MFYNHMTHDQELYRVKNKSRLSKVKIGNGKLIVVEGIRTLAIEYCTSTKPISDILYVPEIDRKLLNVDELMEKDF